METNKDLLRLENEFRDEIVTPKEKPNITRVTKPLVLTKKISDFLDKTTKGDDETKSNGRDKQSSDHHVEMEIMITEEDDDME